MKKRLSLLMAAIMVITMLPMSAFAAATPRVNVTTITDVSVDTDIKVILELDRNTPLKEGKMYFEIKNAQFQGAKEGAVVKPGAYVPPSVPTGTSAGTEVKADKFDIQTVLAGDAPITDNPKLLSKDTFQVLTQDFGPATNDYLRVELTLPLSFVNSVDGDVVLRAVDTDNKVGIGNWEKTIAVVNQSSKALSLYAREPEATVSYDGGEISRFEISNFKTIGDLDKLVIELDKDDYYSFHSGETRVLLDGKVINATNLEWDAKEFKVTIKNAGLKSGGNYGDIVTVIPSLRKMGRSAVAGPVVVNVEAQKTDNTVLQSTSGKIGNVVDFGVTMTIVEKNKKEIPNLWGGEAAEVTVTLKGPKGSFSNRGVEFEVDGARVIVGSLAKVKSSPASNAITFKGTSEIVVGEKVYKDGKFILDGVTDETTEVVFNMKIQVEYDKDGVATLTAAQRGWTTPAVELAKSTPKFTVSTEAVGAAKGRVTETKNVVITEAKEGLLKKGDYVLLFIDSKSNYVDIDAAKKVEATNGMTLKGVAVVGDKDAYLEKFNSSGEDLDKLLAKHVGVSGKGRGTVIVTRVVKPSTGGPAEITFSGISVAVDGSTVDGTYPVTARLNGHVVRKADYVTVGKEYGLNSVKTVFTIGQTAYTVNGEAKVAANAPFIKNNRTMLPVRAIAESLGLTVQWNKLTRTATFTDTNKVAAVVIGSEVMYVNGTPIPLSAKAELLNGTTFVELHSLATAFGVQIDFDNATKQVIVSK